MAVGLYKPGQGYWVRVLTAAFVGVLTLAAAGWVMGQMRQLADRLPRTDWVLVVKSKSDQRVPATGETVTLLGRADETGQFPKVGTAKVASNYEPEAGTLRVTDVEMVTAQADPSRAYALEGGAAGAEGQSAFFAELSGAQSQMAVQPVILEGIGAAAVILIGTAFAYYFTGINRKSCEFLIATDLEMKKVNWSTRKHVLSSTWVVIGAAFLIAGFLYASDYIFSSAFYAMGVLQ